MSHEMYKACGYPLREFTVDELQIYNNIFHRETNN